MFCNKCGEILRDGALRCPVCGANQKKGSKINTECDCDTNKKVTFNVNRPKTHSTYTSGQSGKTFRDATRYVNRISTEEIIRLLKSFFLDFKEIGGRISRRDFWLTSLVLAVITLLLYMFGGAFLGIWILSVLPPKITMCIRRLHDTGRNGAFMLLGLIPIAGPIVLLILFCQPTAPVSWAAAK